MDEKMRMPVDEFQRTARRTVSWASQYLEDLDEIPVRPAVTHGDLFQRLPQRIPEQGRSIDAIIDEFLAEVVPRMCHWNHPRFFGWFNSSSSGPAILADLLAAITNCNAMAWHSSPSASELEQRTVDCLVEMLNLPSCFWGMTHDGGSISTFHALAAARHFHFPDANANGINSSDCPRLYLTKLTHSSVDKSAMALGIGSQNLVRVDSDDQGAMKAADLSDRIAADLRDGLKPFCVVATLGSTSCTSFDRADELADVCHRFNLWLHIDAAHAAPAAMLDETSYLFVGWECADSITINPHKWMFTPLGLSVLLTRHREVLRAAFCLTPDYLRSFATPRSDLMDYGLPLGRRFRALSLWFVMNYFGKAGLRAIYRKHLKLARWFAAAIQRTALYEVVAPVNLSTVTFRQAGQSRSRGRQPVVARSVA